MKKFIIAVIAVLCVALNSTYVQAAEQNSSNQICTDTSEVEDIINQLNSYDYPMDVKFTELPAKDINKIPKNLRFDSIEEAEKFIAETMSRSGTSNINTNENDTFLNSRIGLNAYSGYRNTTVSWWGGGNTSIASLTNAEIQYYYTDSNGGTVSNITVKNSYMTGLYGATWTHLSGTGTALGGMRTKYSVKGTWTIGIAVGVSPINTSFVETIDSPVITLDRG